MAKGGTPNEVDVQCHAGVGGETDQKVPARGDKGSIFEWEANHLSISVLSSPIFSRVNGMFTLA